MPLWQIFWWLDPVRGLGGDTLANPLPPPLGKVLQVEAEVRFLIQQHRAAWLELEFSKLQCRLEAVPRRPQKLRRAPITPLQPPVLQLLQGTAGALLAGLAACPTDAEPNGGALPEDTGLLRKRPSGLPSHPTP